MGQVLLVRHGQASFGSDDYDVLSDLGERQAAVLGRSLATRGTDPSAVLHGQMVRQRRTAEVLADAAGWTLPLECDADWDEMDHLEVLSRLPQQDMDFQAWFEAATDRWITGAADDYAESFATFTGRVEAALRRAADRDGTVVVVTSGGPVSWVVAQLLGADTGTYRRLAAVVVNTGVTKLVTGRRGLTLVSFNEHAHLEAEPALLTYR
jgi:broad specificity phosphatase PhoE